MLAVFVLVYAGMIFGRIPPLALDRTGFALLGALALLLGRRVSLEQATRAVDMGTLALLFGLMVVSAQFRLGGFYSYVVRRLGRGDLSPKRLLALLVGLSGLLSALLANDIVCLAMAPVLVEACARRRLDPKPFLLALALSANVGSAATLIGNPQNMLIGQQLRLGFARYLLEAGVPALLGLVAVWWIVCHMTRGQWAKDTELCQQAAAPAFQRWQTTKGLLVLGAVTLAFLFAPWPREVVALAAAGLLLTSRHTKTRDMLGLVDWQLLVLFIGLFVVHDALAVTGMPEQALGALRHRGVDLAHPGWLFGASVLLSNVVSNVPATMLLLPSAGHPLGGAVLALSSTLAGNLLVVGSIANMIVLDQGARMGVAIGWREHARVGVPTTIVTLLLAAGWLALLAALGG